ncbi:Hypothetical_protein [Hexamita inflata]|uniref:Hypothetical_protein n=1 Tax=Hexamita inflata TaxID=28002 RepID=A0AA86TIF7_9EUKA|nr:Hypothetical protein HINF_LOCUS5866 [Hexamita inflata]
MIFTYYLIQLYIYSYFYSHPFFISFTTSIFSLRAGRKRSRGDRSLEGRRAPGRRGSPGPVGLAEGVWQDPWTPAQPLLVSRNTQTQPSCKILFLNRLFSVLVQNEREFRVLKRFVVQKRVYEELYLKQLVRSIVCFHYEDQVSDVCKILLVGIMYYPPPRSNEVSCIRLVLTYLTIKPMKL